MRSWPLLHGILFYVVWFLAVRSVSTPGGESTTLAIQVSFCALCLVVSRKRLRREVAFMGALTGFGGAIDSVAAHLGLIIFPHTTLYLLGYPLWMWGMWASFATAFSTSLSWMTHRISAQLLLGAIGGSLSLYAASKLGAVEFPRELSLTLAYFGIAWALLMVGGSWIYRRLQTQ